MTSVQLGSDVPAAEPSNAIGSDGSLKRPRDTEYLVADESLDGPMMEPETKRARTDEDSGPLSGPPSPPRSLPAPVRALDNSPTAIAAAAALASIPPAASVNASTSMPPPSFGSPNSSHSAPGMASLPDENLEAVLLALTDLGQSFAEPPPQQLEYTPTKLSPTQGQKMHSSNIQNTPPPTRQSARVQEKHKGPSVSPPTDRPKNIISINAKIVRNTLRQINALEQSQQQHHQQQSHPHPHPQQQAVPDRLPKQHTLREAHEPGISVPSDLKKCNCKNSRCLKLYCECFRARVFCHNCNCAGCANVPSNAEKVRASVRYVLERNPIAFSSKIEPESQGEMKLLKGCKCSKTGCLKNYCECFHAGVTCSATCRCVGCKNYPGGLSDLIHSRRLLEKRRISPVKQHEMQQDRIAYVQQGLPNAHYPSPTAELSQLKRQASKDSKPRPKAPKRFRGPAVKAVLDKTAPEHLVNLANELLTNSRLAASAPMTKNSDPEILPDAPPLPMPNLPRLSEAAESAILQHTDLYLREILDRINSSEPAS